jgi:hypothetical protein
MRVLIRPVNSDEFFRVHLPDGIRDFETVEEGVAFARDIVPGQLRKLAKQAGAEQVEVRMDRVDRTAPVAVDWGEPVYLDTELTFVAMGRPSPAQETVTFGPAPGALR